MLPTPRSCGQRFKPGFPGCRSLKANFALFQRGRQGCKGRNGPHGRAEPLLRACAPRYNPAIVVGPESIVVLTVGEQAAVASDPSAVELELNPAVENRPQRQLFGFTRRVPHDHAPPVVPNR